MSGRDMFDNSLGWLVWKNRFFTAGAFLVAGSICLILKQFMGTPTSNAQAPAQRPTQVAAQTQQQTPAQRQLRPVFQQQQGQAQAAQTLNIMAIVNGQQISRQQLADECLKRYGNEVVERLVNRQLILNECQRQNITISPKDIDDEITKIATKVGIAPDRYLSMLQSKRKITPEQYRREIIWPTLALRRLARGRTQVAPEEIQRRLETEIGPKVQVRLIALDDQATAEKVLTMVQQSPEEFGKIAKDYSVDVNSASTRGMVPPIRLHIGDPTIEKAAFSLQIGQVSNVIPIANQFIIMKCERIFPSQVNDITPEQRQMFEARLKDQISEGKLAEVSQDIFKNLQENTKIINVMNDAQLRNQYPGVAAQIGDVQVSVRQLAEECILRHGSEVLEGEVNRTLITQQLKRAKISVGDADIQAEITRAADSFGMLKEDGTPDIEKWLEYITKTDKVTVESYVHDVVWPSVALRILSEKAVQITDEDIQKGFESNFGARVEALAIVCANQKQAQEVWNMANQNPTDEHFGNLANAYSVEPASKANFGRVPPIQLHGGRKALEDEAFRLNPGELSGIVNIGESWVILRCVGRTKPRVTDLSLVRDELYKDIHEKKVRIAMAKRFEQVRQASQIDNYLAGTSQAGAQKLSNRTSQAVQGRIPFSAQQR